MRLGLLVRVMLALALLPALPAAADGEPQLPTLADGARRFEPVRVRWRLTRPLALRGPAGPASLPAGAALTQTRTLETKDASFAYVVADDAATYGFVGIDALAAAATRLADDGASPSPFTGALASLLPGHARRGRASTYEENAGSTKVGTRAVAITIDLCPTHRRFEAELFRALAALGKERGQPVPVTAFVSGNWLNSRQARRTQEIDQLRRYRDDGGLAITFANHSLTHPYHFGRLPYDQDFLLARGVDLRREVLDTELALMRRGFAPAPFFRFPGLISTPALQRELHERYSLVDVGAGSWPGTGQKIAPGDVVLVHGNGGEPEGVRRLLAWLKQSRAAIMSGAVELAPLADTLR